MVVFSTNAMLTCFFILSLLSHKLETMVKWQHAAAPKSLQSCPTLCDPIDGSPPGSPVPGILQARTLEWAAISFSNAWMVMRKSYMFSSSAGLGSIDSKVWMPGVWFQTKRLTSLSFNSLIYERKKIKDAYFIGLLSLLRWVKDFAQGEQ